MSVPAFLSYPLADDFAIEPIDPGVTFENDAGGRTRRPRYRLVRTRPTVPDVLTCSWLLRQDQFDEFDAFHDDDLMAGSAGFQLGLDGFTQNTMFLEPPSVDVDGARLLYRVSAKLMRGGQRTAIEPEPIDPGIVVHGPLIADVPENDPTVFSVETLLSTVSSSAGGLHVVSCSLPTFGYVWMAGAEVVFEPFTERIGPATFTYVVRDAASREAVVSAQLTVFYRNEACLRLKLGNVEVTPPAGSALVFDLGDLGPYVAPPASGCSL